MCWVSLATNIEIASDNCTGIYSVGADFLPIYKNTITIKSNFNKYTGISVLNPNNTSVSSNTINGATTTYTNKSDTYKVGITIRNSGNTDIGCNSIYTCSVALQLIDDCEFSTITKNKFITSGVGLMYGDGISFDAITSNQVGTQNEWIGAFSKYKAWFSVNTGQLTNIINSTYLVDFTSSINSPIGSIKSEVPGQQWFYNSKVISSGGCGSFKPTTKVMYPIEALTYSTTKLRKKHNDPVWINTLKGIMSALILNIKVQGVIQIPNKVFRY